MQSNNFTEITNKNNYKLEIVPPKFKSESKKDRKPPPKPLWDSSENNFVVFIGRPGSGKTSTALSMITTKNRFYWKKYDKIFIISPSILGNNMERSHPIFSLPQEQLFNELTVETIDDILEQIEETDNHCLLLFDDCQTDMAKGGVLKKMKHLIFNRRHIAGGLTIYITSQVWNNIPLSLRKACTHMFLYSTKNRTEIESIYKELINGIITQEQFDKMLEYVFDEKYQFLFMDIYNQEKKVFYKKFNLLSIHTE